MPDLGFIYARRCPRSACPLPARSRSWVMRSPSPDVHQSIIRSLQAVQRSQRNREGGYWIAGSDPGAAQHSVMRSWKLNDVTAVMLTTDGLSDASSECRANGTECRAESSPT
jgi:hypothetical protein